MLPFSNPTSLNRMQQGRSPCTEYATAGPRLVRFKTRASMPSKAYTWLPITPMILEQLRRVLNWVIKFNAHNAMGHMLCWLHQVPRVRGNDSSTGEWIWSWSTDVTFGCYSGWLKKPRDSVGMDKTIKHRPVSARGHYFVWIGQIPLAAQPWQCWHTW